MNGVLGMEAQTSVLRDARLDPVLATVIQNGLIAATTEMAATLERAALSPLLFEFKDYSAVVTDADGRLWAEAPGLLGFVGSVLPEVIATGVSLRGRTSYGSGDLWAANLPFTSGTHISDTTLYTPIFFRGALLGFCGTTAHWADVGGKEPGGWCADSTDVFQEGLKLDHVRLGTLDALDSHIRTILVANVRIPDIVLGDLRAQVAALRTGVERVQSLAEKHGADAMINAMAANIDATAALLRARLRELPNCRALSVEEIINHDGVEKDRPRRVTFLFEKRDDTARFDFTGSSETVSGPINLPLPGTRGALNAALKSVLIPRQPTNHGAFAALDLIAPPDTIANPLPPGPTDQCGYLWETIFDMAIRALSHVAPERCPAGVGRICGSFFTRPDQRFGEPFIMVESTVTGWGATPVSDGGTMTYAIAGDTRNIPAEVIELRYPVRVVECSFRRGSTGAGTYRGGPGLHKVFEILEDGISVHGFFLQLVSRGASGGGDGVPARMIIQSAESERVFEDRFTSFGPLKVGDRVIIETGGGGGWGDPAQRDPSLVELDLAGEVLTEDEASAHYRGVSRAAATGEAIDVGQEE